MIRSASERTFDLCSQNRNSNDDEKENYQGEYGNYSLDIEAASKQKIQLRNKPKFLKIDSLRQDVLT